MRTILMSLVATGLLFVLGQGVRADDARDILEKAAKAHGGLDKLGKERAAEFGSGLGAGVVGRRDGRLRLLYAALLHFQFVLGFDVSLQELEVVGLRSRRVRIKRFANVEPLFEHR